MIDLNLLNYQDHLSVKTEEGKKYVFDPIRKKYLVMTPEESVRQLLIEFFRKEKGISKNYFGIEKSFKINERLKRFDLLIFDESHHPIMLIECKSPKVKINQDVFEQVAWYNYHFKVPYLLVTNGIVTYCCSIDYDKKEFSFMDKIPDF